MFQLALFSLVTFVPLCDIQALLYYSLLSPLSLSTQPSIEGEGVFFLGNECPHDLLLCFSFMTFVFFVVKFLSRKELHSYPILHRKEIFQDLPVDTLLFDGFHSEIFTDFFSQNIVNLGMPWDCRTFVL